ncbi:uncharacterized protein [Leptinotarsa decemlineata]|uniref:uncharacterized protein n=1 Tax=Leptinotarsa decemlineata TaxID=7539 RepID=UPI003D30BC77
MFYFHAIFLSISSRTHFLQINQVFYDIADDTMKIYLLILLAVFYLIHTSESGLKKGIVSVDQENVLGGLWKSKLQWKAHWVKDWELKKIYVPIWRKVWAPVAVREWIPFPKTPVKQ